MSMIYEISVFYDEGNDRYCGSVCECRDENDFGREILIRAGHWPTLEEAQSAYSDFGTLEWRELEPAPLEPRQWVAQCHKEYQIYA
jgi:hypothetical protein